MHTREVDGRTLTFGHSGWLWRDAYLLYDRETDSLWHHQTGVAMSGPLRGKVLARVPSTAVMTFAAWRAEHPGTLVVPKPATGMPEADVDVYAPRNRTRSFGLGIDLPGASRLYPERPLGDLHPIEDVVAGVPVVVVRDVVARHVAAYDRRVDGDVLSFEAQARGDLAPLLRERGGSRAWSLRSGAPEPGTGARTPLRPLPATTWDVEAWRAHHPGGTVWSPR